MKRPILIVFVGGVVLSSLLVGASLYKEQVEKHRRKRNLQTLGLYYHTFLDRHGRGPADLTEFREGLVPAIIFDKKLVAEMNRNVGTVLRQIESRDVIVVWRGDLTGLRGTYYAEPYATGYVLGYEAEVQNSSGWVLHGDGSVRELSAEQFEKRPKLPIMAPKP